MPADDKQKKPVDQPDKPADGTSPNESGGSGNYGGGEIKRPPEDEPTTGNR